MSVGGPAPSAPAGAPAAGGELPLAAVDGLIRLLSSSEVFCVVEREMCV